MTSASALLLVLAPLPPAAPAQQACQWSQVAPAPQARVESQTVVIDERLYVFGGFYDASLNATPRVDVYDPVADTWTPLADMLVTNTHHTAVVDGDEVWIAGGFLGPNGGPAMPTVMRYDVSKDSWRYGPRLPVKRAGGALVRLDRELHYFGGFATRRDSAAEHWVLDLDDVQAGWSDRAPLPTGRGHLSGAVLDGFVYAIGGQLGHDVSPQDLDLVDRYDPLSDTWTPVASLPSPRSHFEASTFVLDGRIVIAGGRDNQPGGAPTLDRVTTYDPGLDAWIELLPLPVPLLGPSVKPIGDELFLTTGGSAGNLPESENYVRELNAELGPMTRVNAGGQALSLAEEWCPDAFFAGGESLANPVAIAGTTEDELYWTEHTGSASVPGAFGYHFPVADGDYRLRLHFAETTWSSAGERVFDVTLEGTTILDDYDIVAEVGPLTAVVRTFDVHVEDGMLDLELLSSVDRPQLSAIEVETLPPGFFVTYCQGAPNSVGPGATLGFIGSTSISAGDLRLVASGMPQNKPAIFGLSGAQGSLPLGNGILCLGGPLSLSPTYSTGSGTLELAVPLGPLTPVGPGWNFQVWYLDDPPFRYNFTGALQLHFTP